MNATTPGRLLWTEGVQVLTANCEAWAVKWPATGWQHYTGPEAYDTVTGALYDAGHIGAYYSARDYWGTHCPYTARHTCGLEHEREAK